MRCLPMHQLSVSARLLPCGAGAAPRCARTSDDRGLWKFETRRSRLRALEDKWLGVRLHAVPETNARIASQRARQMAGCGRRVPGRDVSEAVQFHPFPAGLERWSAMAEQRSDIQARSYHAYVLHHSLGLRDLLSPGAHRASAIFPSTRQPDSLRRRLDAEPGGTG